MEIDDSDDDFVSNNELLSEQDGWSWKRPQTINVYHTINLHCRDNIIYEISKVLNKFGVACWNEFKNSCFGHLSKLPENIVRCNQSIHYVVSRQIIFDEGDKSELWFRVNDKNLRFSREEHALVTGLRFGDSNFNPNEKHTIHDKFFYNRFLGKKKISVSNLWGQFIQRTLGRNASDYVKVAKVLFVYCVVFGFDITKINVADWVWALVEDESAWETFPWGSYSFQILVHYINRIRRNISSKQRQTYHVNGFMTAFQAWIYCAIPNLGISSGGITDITRIPRILRYAFIRTNLNIEDISGELQSTLRADDQEKEKIYWTSLEPMGSPFLVVYRHSESNFRKRRQTCNEISGRHQEVCATQTQVTQGRQPTQVLQRTRNVRVCRSTSPSIEANSQQGNSHTVGEECPDVHTDNVQVSAGRPSTMQGGIPSTSPIFGPDDPIYSFTWSQRQTLVKEVGEYTFGRMMELMDTVIPQHIENVLRRVLTEYMPLNRMVDHEENNNETLFTRTSPIVFTNYSDDNRPRTPIHHEIGNEPVSALMPDFREVRRRVLSVALQSPFQLDDKRGKDYKKFLMSKTKINVGIEFAVDASWFREIENPNEIVENSHLDAYLAILHSDPSFAGLHNVCNNVVVTSSSFVTIVRQIWFDHHKEGEEDIVDPTVELKRLLLFVTGELPKWGRPKPWYDYEQITMPCYLPDHWITITVYLKEHTIGIFDSMQHTLCKQAAKARISFMKPLARILPQVLKYSGYWKANTEYVPKYTQWKIKVARKEDTLVQQDSKSCGLFSLMHIEQILTRRIQSITSAQDVKKYRMKVAHTIFKFSTDSSC